MKRSQINALVESLGIDPNHVQDVILRPTGIDVVQAVWHGEHDVPAVFFPGEQDGPLGTASVATFVSTFPYEPE